MLTIKVGNEQTFHGGFNRILQNIYNFPEKHCDLPLKTNNEMMKLFLCEATSVNIFQNIIALRNHVLRHSFAHVRKISINFRERGHGEKLFQKF